MPAPVDDDKVNIAAMAATRGEEAKVHVVTHDGDNKDDSGVAAIVKAFIKNPAGALQIVVFIGGLYGVYYTIQGEIADVRAAQVTNYERLNGKIEILISSDNDEKAKIDQLYARSDTRYQDIKNKLGDHDVDIAKIISGIDYLIKQNDARPQRPDLPNKP